jgi:hypothetical protein
MKPEWQLRQEHHDQVTRCLRAGGEMDSVGRLRQWFGQASLARLRNIGHSALGFEQCQCRQPERA